VYAFTIRNPFGPGKVLTGARNIIDPSVLVFGAGETKHQYFDFFVGALTGDQTLSPGLYDFSGAYGSHNVTLPTVTIAGN